MREKKDIDQGKENEETVKAAWDAEEAPEEAFDPGEETPDMPEEEEPETKEPGDTDKSDDNGPEAEDSKPEEKETDSETKEADPGAAKDSKQGGPFRRKDKKDKKDEQIEELTDRVRRQMAEFDNFRKRTEKEKSQMFETGAKSVIEKILPVIDNFERGLATIPENEKGGAFADGMEKVYKQIMTVMDDLGVKAIEAVGCEFDPNLHNAVMHIDDDDLGENIVAEEFQKGYTYRDSVVRHSMVKVAN